MNSNESSAENCGAGEAPMPMGVFVDRIVDDGIEAVKQDYTDKPSQLAGAIEGFESCRGKSADEMIQLYTEANRESYEIHSDRPDDLDAYWASRCKADEIEWVLNCLSGALQTALLSWLPTVHGVMKAAEVVGVREPAHE